MSGFDDFMAAIGWQESGNKYWVVNSGSGALGKYQIMPQNVGYWAWRYLGVSMTPDEFLHDPQKQETLARAVLGEYYDKYGPRGAAAAWYSGNPGLANSYSSQPGGPSVGAYVDSVMSLMGNLPAGAGGSGQQDIPTDTIDKRVKDSAKPADSTTPMSSPGAEASTAPGTEAVTAPGTEAVTANGAEAAANTGTDATEPVASATHPLDGLGPMTPTHPAHTAPDAGNTGREITVAAAKQWLGAPYVFGGGGTTGPSTGTAGMLSGFDCSGLVQYALAQAGVRMPRLSYDQLAAGQRTALGNLQMGDLVGFGDGGHLGIYLGNNQIIEAPNSSDPVRIRTISPGEDAWGVSLSNLY